MTQSDLAGNRVIGIQNNAVAVQPPKDGEVYTWNAAANAFIPQTPSGGGGLPAGGSVGQPIVNTGSGTGDWGNTIRSADGDLNLIADATATGSISGGAGTADASAGPGQVFGGDDNGAGAGEALIQGGTSFTDSVAGADARVKSGDASVGDADSGNVVLEIGNASGGGDKGVVKIVNATTATGMQTATMTNSPVAGNPTLYAVFDINGTQVYVAGWAVP